MLACSRARASSRAAVSRLLLRPASRAISPARSWGAAGWAAGAGDVGVELSLVLIVLLDPLLSAEFSPPPVFVSPASGGPGGRLSRSRCSARSAKVLSVMVPLLVEDIVCLRGKERPRPGRKVVGPRPASYD